MYLEYPICSTCMRMNELYVLIVNVLVSGQLATLSIN